MWSLLTVGLLFVWLAVYRSTRTKRTVRNACDPNVSRLGVYGEVGDPQIRASSPSPTARALFRQGMALAYGLAMEEALKTLEEAVQEDPFCVMCHWGLAYVVGPNFNKDLTDDERKACARSISTAERLLQDDRAQRKTSRMYDLEAAYVSAMSLRFPETEREWIAGGGEWGFSEKYADAMERMCFQFKHEVTPCVLYAQAMMESTPWRYYQENGELKPSMQRVYLMLRSILSTKQGAYHPQALHLMIHLTEAAPAVAGRALGEEAADRLAAMAGDKYGVTHLLHMPGHTYLRLGRWTDCVRVNERAVEADQLWIKNCLQPYYPRHQRAQLVAGAMMYGNVSIALQHSFSVAEMKTDGDLMSMNPPLDVPRAFPVVLARFGMWKEISHLRPLFADIGDDASLLGGAFTYCIWKYTEGLALAGMGNLASALEVQRQLERAASQVPPDEIPPEHRFWPAHQVLASTMVLTLKARLSQLRSEIPQAILLMEESIRQHIPIPYMEPEHWYLPLKQCLGKLLLDDKQYTKAIRVYLEDLEDHPLNAWSYLGLAQAYRQRDGNGSAKAIHHYHRFQDAWANAEVPIRSSCCEFGC